jgi:hypothetical protein
MGFIVHEVCYFLHLEILRKINLSLSLVLLNIPHSCLDVDHVLSFLVCSLLTLAPEASFPREALPCFLKRQPDHRSICHFRGENRWR